MEGLTADSICTLVQIQKRLFKLIEFSIIFENQDIIFFGDDFNRPFEFVSFFSVIVDNFQEAGQSG